ncbi:MAG: hypothetical protein LBC33_03630 [Mycoplasmataceae bacterium]|nr:hypothetical protein [Mycoplasmataceae bacterium]
MTKRKKANSIVQNMYIGGQCLLLTVFFGLGAFFIYIGWLVGKVTEMPWNHGIIFGSVFLFLGVADLIFHIYFLRSYWYRSIMHETRLNRPSKHNRIDKTDDI